MKVQIYVDEYLSKLRNAKTYPDAIQVCIDAALNPNVPTPLHLNHVLRALKHQLAEIRSTQVKKYVIQEMKSS